MLTLLGMIGSVLFSVAWLPTAYTAIRRGRNPGVPVSTVWLLFAALMFYTTWCFLAFGFHLPFVSGLVEIASWGVVLFFIYFPHPEGV